MNIRQSFVIANAVVALLLLASASARAEILFDTEILSMNLSGGPFPMPLASDPGNALGDSIDGYGFVNTQVTINASSQRVSSPGPQSLGQACGINSSGCPPTPPIDPNALDGTSYFVNSFFDVFYDISLTDVDARPGRDYAGQPDGATIIFQDVQMLNFQSNFNAVFDKDVESFDLLMPPQSDFYIGFPVDLLLGADINGNGTDDRLATTLFSYAIGDENRSGVTLITNQLWRHQHDTAARLEGFIGDVGGSGGVPFQIGAQLPNGQPDPAAFGGPGEVESRLVNDVVPEPGTFTLTLFGVFVFAVRRKLG